MSVKNLVDSGSFSFWITRLIHLVVNWYFVFQFGVSSTIVGLVFLCTSVFYTISSPIVGYISDRLVNNNSVFFATR